MKKKIMILLIITFLFMMNMSTLIADEVPFYITMIVNSEGGSITSEQGGINTKQGFATHVEKGKELNIYLSPDEGYEIDKVLVDGNAIDLKELVYEKDNPNGSSKDGVAIYTFKNVNKDHTITVNDKLKSKSEETLFYITMIVNGEGGSITSEQGGINTEQGFTTHVEKGKELNIYLSPDEGYEIEKVLVDGKAIDLNELVYEKDNPNASSEDGVAIYTFKNVNKDHTIVTYYKSNNSQISWLKASEWAEEELFKAEEMQIIPNRLKYSDLTDNLTRLDFAHVVVKLYEKLTGNKAIASGNYPFIDIDDEEVLKAYNLGITNGTSEFTFNPKALITREQMATMMTRTLTKAGIDTKVDLEKVNKFADDGEMHDWGKESIYYMSSIEIIKGIGNNTFNVLGNATREQALLISVRSAEKFSR